MAIAVLAVSANIMVERGVAALRVTEFSNSVDSPISRARTADLPTPTPAAPPARSGADRRSVDAAHSAVDRFDSAARRRSDEKSAVLAGEYAAARSELQAAAATIAKHSPMSSHTLDNTLRQFLQRGDELVRQSDLLHATNVEYVQHLEAMDSIIETQINEAWHAFGRVFARQSLLRLRTDLHDLRQRYEPFRLKDTTSAVEDVALAAGENALATDLQAQAGATQVSKRAPWLDAMYSHIDALVTLRKARALAPDALQTQSRALTLQRTVLWNQLTAAESLTNDGLLRMLPYATAPPLAPAAGGVAHASAVPWTPRQALRYSILSQANSGARALLAALTGSVLLVIGWVSYRTVRSVSEPVRRILRATADLAGGNPNVRVERGGIRELDKLAIAFNDMASRLSAAQESSKRHQDDLESKVLLRTHKLRQLADQDPLTSLANRRRLLGLLTEAIAAAEAKHHMVGVFFLDIDNFKNYNDGMGHVFGDRVIMSVANRLEELAEGLGFVARFGGDEFTFVYEVAVDEKAIYDVGAQLIEAFQGVLAVDDRELRVSISVGASIYPAHAANAQDLLRAADSALFRAKELGRTQLAMFTPALTESAALRFQTEQGLRRALARGEFELAYQPEVDMSSLEVGLVEALLRWRLPSGQLIGPGEFLSIAEQSGLIVSINEWVLNTAIATASQWHHGAWPKARVAVNITPRQLLEERFVDSLLEMLDEHRLPRHCIELELTESVLQTGSATIAVLHHLQASGIAIALDDFGTGYSSLTSLEQLPLSRIKLDRSLIQNVDSSVRSAAIAQAILDLSSALELDVTAEGIERPEQFAWLLGQRSMHLQGYLFARPLQEAEIVPAVTAMTQTMQDILLGLPKRRAEQPLLTAVPYSTRVTAING